MEKLLPILSGSLREIIKSIVDKTDDPIATEILKIDTFVSNFNDIYYAMTQEFRSAIINNVIEPCITDEVRMISIRPGELEVSFLPKGKDPEYTNPGVWGRKNRQTGKPAKIFQKLLEKEFKTKEWEIFSNLIKAELCDCTNFELVSGEDIRKWYCEDTYYRIEGSLGNSCMRYENAQDYFDLYVDCATMLITTKNGLLTGRAIVWELPEGITIMDRVYVCFDYLENCFFDYAKEHGWWIRENNSLLNTGCEQYWYSPDDNYERIQYRCFTLEIPKQYEYFPYVDSFRYYDGHRCLTTSPQTGYDYSLDCTDGDMSHNEYISCDRCGTSFECYDNEIPDELHWSEYSDGYYCDECSWYCEPLCDYVSIGDPPTDVECNGCRQEYPRSYISENILLNPTGNDNPDHIVKIDDRYYFVDSDTITFNEETKEYEIRSDPE